MLGDLSTRVRAQWREKAAGSAALTAFFCVPYFALQRVVLMRPRRFPPTAVDDAIDFDPRWTWVYQSGYVLIAIVPWLLDRRHDLARYIRTFVWVSLAGFACFFFLPVIGPRPQTVPGTGMYALLISYDRPTNEFPSLHIALMTLTILTAARASRGRMASSQRVTVLSTATAWAAAVGFAALATKQHYAIDLPAGLILAVAVDRWLA